MLEPQMKENHHCKLLTEPYTRLEAYDQNLFLIFPHSLFVNYFFF